MNRHSTETLLDNINDSKQYPKLRTYKLFKEDHDFEPDLRIMVPKCRYALTRFRLSSHNLEIEMGRYTKPKTPAEQRFCRLCNNGDTEGEMHFLLICTSYESLRLVLLATAS